MPFWKVRPGAVFAHHNQPQVAGTVLELPRRLAQEFTHALDECTEDGELLHAALPAWATALETVRDHETVDVLRAQQAAQRQRVLDLQHRAEDDAQALAQLQHTLAFERASLEALETALEEAVLRAQALQDQRLAAEAATTGVTADPPPA